MSSIETSLPHCPIWRVVGSGVGRGEGGEGVGRGGREVGEGVGRGEVGEGVGRGEVGEGGGRGEESPFKGEVGGVRISESLNIRLCFSIQLSTMKRFRNNFQSTLPPKKG